MILSLLRMIQVCTDLYDGKHALYRIIVKTSTRREPLMLRTHEERQAEAVGYVCILPQYYSACFHCVHSQWKQAIDAATELELQPKDPAMIGIDPHCFDEHSPGWSLSQGLAQRAMLSLPGA